MQMQTQTQIQIETQIRTQKTHTNKKNKIKMQQQKKNTQNKKKQSPAGHIFTLLDENNQKINKGSIILEGRKFKSNKNGDIYLPFANENSKNQAIILQVMCEKQNNK